MIGQTLSHSRISAKLGEGGDLRAEEYVFELGAEGWVVRMLIDDYGKTASTLSLFAERAWRGAV